MHNQRVPSFIPSLFIGDDARLIEQGLAVTPNTAGNVNAVKQAKALQMEVLTLTAAEIEIDEANDYGSLKLVDFPSSNIIIVGAQVDLVCTVDGTVITDPEDIDWALGTVALTSTNFSNAGEKNVVTEADVAALGVMQKATATAEANVGLAQGSNALYLNIQATIGTTATQSFSGTIRLYFIDLGAH
jgi:hypothetical protein